MDETSAIMTKCRETSSRGEALEGPAPSGPHGAQIFRKHRSFIISCVLGLIPWLYACVFMRLVVEPFFITLPKWHQEAAAILLDILAPLRRLFNLFSESLLSIKGSEHCWYWLAFSVVNIAWWFALINFARILLRRSRPHRRALIAACIVGSVPWLLICGYLGFAVRLFEDLYSPLIFRVVAWVMPLFGPIHIFFPKGFLVTSSSHMYWPDFYWSWSIFTVINIASWLFLFVGIRILYVRLRRRPSVRPSKELKSELE